MRTGLLFKEGNAAKLTLEMENIVKWEGIMPGLPPKVKFFQSDGDSASMLMEYLGGCTFQEVILTGTPQLLQTVLFRPDADRARHLVFDSQTGRNPGPLYISAEISA